MKSLMPARPARCDSADFTTSSGIANYTRERSPISAQNVTGNLRAAMLWQDIVKALVGVLAVGPAWEVLEKKTTRERALLEQMTLPCQASCMMVAPKQI